MISGKKLKPWTKNKRSYSMKISTDSAKTILGVEYPACTTIDVSDSMGNKLIQCEGFKEVKQRRK